MTFDDWWQTEKARDIVPKGPGDRDRAARAWNAAVMRCATFCEEYGRRTPDIRQAALEMAAENIRHFETDVYC